MATASIISAELRDWKRSTYVNTPLPQMYPRVGTHATTAHPCPDGGGVGCRRYEPNEEEVAVLQKCRARESNLQSLGSLTGLGLGMLFCAHLLLLFISALSALSCSSAACVALVCTRALMS